MHKGSNRQSFHIRFLLLSSILICVLIACGQAFKQPLSSPAPANHSVITRTIPTPITRSAISGVPGNTVNSIVSNGVIYAGTINQGIYALRANNGSLLWHTRVEGAIEELPLVEQGIVYVSSYVGQNGPAYLSALRISDGIQIWRYRSNSYIYQPIVGSNQVYIAAQEDGLTALQTGNGTTIWHITGTTNQKPFLVNTILYLSMNIGNQPINVYALRADNGSVVWNHPGGTTDTFLLQGGVLYICCSQGTLSALRMRDGHAIWNQKIATNISLQPLQITDGILYLMATQISLGTPTASKPGHFPLALAMNAFISSATQHAKLPQKVGKPSLYVIRTSDGAVLWQKSLLAGNNSFASWFQVSQGVIYASILSIADQNNTVLMALQSGNGQTLWQNTIQGNPVSSLLNSGILYSIGAAEQSAVYALNMGDGRLLWSSSINGNVFNPPTLSKQLLSISTDTGIIYTLSIDNGTILWHYQTSPGS